MRLKITFSFFSFFLWIQAFAQLPGFSLSVTATDESCTGNATLEFSVSGTASGASVIYNIYQLPDVTTPIATLSGDTFSGLTAGDYQVVATQSLNGQTSSESENVTITDTIVQLQYQLSGQPAVCVNNGQITAIVIQGNAVSYEIISGPVTAPLQSSPTFTGLGAGVYVIRVFDECGEGVVQTYTLTETQAGANIAAEPTVGGDCDTLLVGVVITPGPSLAVAYPMTITCTVYPPGGGNPIVFTQTITGPNNPGQVFEYSEEIPNYEGASFTYTIAVTDNCGNNYETTSVVSGSENDPGYSILSGDCAPTGAQIFNITAGTMTDAPDTYPGTIPYDFTNEIGTDNLIVFTNLPLGTYEFLVYDLCGNPSKMTIELVPTGGNQPSVTVQEGCEPGFGSLALSGNPVSVIITAAPSAYPITVPLDVTANIGATGVFVINGLPAGVYTFHTMNSCGTAFDVSATVQGYQETTNVDIIKHCGSFDLGLYHTSNGTNSQEFFLQEYNSVTGLWMHPFSGTPYIEGTEPMVGNSYSLSNNSINYNIAATGTFRIMKLFKSLANGVFQFIPCIDVIFDFQFGNPPQITDVYSFSCSGNAFDVIVEANGLATLQYRITEKDGVPFLIENGPSNVFTGLQQAEYNFQVEDGCGNIVNRLFDITEPFVFAISGTTFCDGQAASLSVPDFPFMDYQWWKGTDTATILSTGATLEFNPFEGDTDGGIYHVRIQNSDPLSCIDFVLDFSIPENISPPVAGTGSAVSYCDRPQTDLFSLLTAPFDLGGTWTEVESSGALIGNTVDTSMLTAGIYHFIYTVTDPCDSDSATVEITILASPQDPIASSLFGGCAGAGIQLNASGDAAAVYEWTGPNGFSSNEQNPFIDQASSSNSGTYTVTATIGDCVSLPSSIEVSVGVVPELAVAPSCNEEIRVLTVSPVNETFDPSTATYAWSGPGTFTAAGNPVAITGNPPGVYSVTITTAEGCAGTANVTVTNTLCVIQQGISPNNDGLNDGFDLTGFEVENLKIFNRYGMTVFESENYTNQWHGQDYKGRMLPAGAYYYLVWLATGEERTGWVYVNREH